MSEAPVDVFSEQDKTIITELALGMTGVRADAVSIYRASLRVHGIRHGDPYFDFMSEVDNPIPDLTLRARYRSAVIEQSRRGRP